MTLYHGDNRQIHAWLDADILVTDPPYGIGYKSGWSDLSTVVGDDSTIPRNEALNNWGKKPALVFGSWRVQRPAGVRQILIWDKGDSAGMGDLSLPWGNHEEIYVLGAGWVGKRGSGVLRVPPIATTEHPTPKPVRLIERLIKHCPKGVVADPFAGSGSTLVACKQLGRRAIGVECVERYCAIAADRLRQGTFASLYCNSGVQS
mgnify:FL=1